jgi:tryptophan-rich sensory protein
MIKPSNYRELCGLAGWLLLAIAAAALGGIGSIGAPEFYQQLALPPWAPPAGVFGPVWSLLYTLMGVASWRIWCQAGFKDGSSALTLYFIQLMLNSLWSWLFFNWQQGALAFAEIILLAAVLSVTLVSFWKIDRLAGFLLLPYLAWVAFATALAWSAWQLNPLLLS